LAGPVCLVAGEGTALGWIDFADSGFYTLLLNEAELTYEITLLSPAEADDWIRSPRTWHLASNRPNPFSRQTLITCELVSCPCDSFT